MASVCGGCLAMMAAGVPITRPVAGVAMGLLLDEEGGGGGAPQLDSRSSAARRRLVSCSPVLVPSR
eukprot:4339156-Prymnesium_polylepis.1